MSQLLFLIQSADPAPANIGLWGPIAAVAILVALIVVGWRRMNFEEPAPTGQAVDRCGPGCICGGANVRARQDVTVYVQQPQPNYQQQQQQPQIVYLQPPPLPAQPQVVYLQAPPQPEIRYLQPPQPQPQQQPQHLPVRQPVRYLPAPQHAYPPEPPPQYQPQYYPPQQPQSYYAGPEPYYDEYQQHYLPPAPPVRQLPPQMTEEVRRQYQREREKGRRR